MSIAEGAKFCSSCGFAFTPERAAIPTPIRGITPSGGMGAVEGMSYDTLGRLAAALDGRYAIEKELGRGGMATVYLAKDLKHDRDVAIKVLLPELSASIGADRFEREIRLAAKLQHPHILGLFDSGAADGLLYYVMPFVKGESLRDRLTREGMLPIEDAITITLEVCGALGHAHALGIVHRDIKPENILLQGEHALVADFGIARAVSEAGAQKLTQTGMAVGTPVYMAPEQAVGEAAGPSADLYSLGCVLYEMLAGEPPFTGKNAVQIMARHAMEQVPSIRIVRSAVPDEIEQAIFAVLGKVPADRPQTAADFASRMGLQMGSTASMRVMRGATAARRIPTPGSNIAYGRTPTVQYAIEPLPPVPGWKSPKVLVGVALLLVLVYALGFWRFGPLAKGGGAVMDRDARRIAVLYFEDKSKEGNLGPLADGLTEGLIRALGSSTSLQVISQAGVEKFRGGTVLPDSIARALHAGYLVRGEVENGGDKVLISVRLDDRSGVNLKRASFAIPGGNGLAMRDSLVLVASDLIRSELKQEVLVSEQRASTAKAGAWLLLQRGEAAQKGGESARSRGDTAAFGAAFRAADSLYAAAENEDAKWAEPVIARAGLAYRRSRLVGSDGTLIRGWVTTGLDHVNRALALDPKNADGLEVRGNLRYWSWLQIPPTDAAQARALLLAAKTDLEQATTINKNQAGAYATLSHLYNQDGTNGTRTDVSIAAQRALEADEFLANADVILGRLFFAQYDDGQFEKASQRCGEAVSRFPSSTIAARCQLYLLTAKNRDPNVATAWRLADSVVARFAPARRAYERLRADMLVGVVLARASLNQKALADSARHVIRRSEGDATIDATRELAFSGAFAYTTLGDNGEAVRLLKQYLAANPQRARVLAEDPGWWFKPLEKDPQFRQAVGAPR